MLVKFTATRQIAIPVHVLEALCAKPGRNFWIEERAEGVLLRARRVVHARLAPLHAKIRRGRGTFGVDACSVERHGTELRD